MNERTALATKLATLFVKLFVDDIELMRTITRHIGPQSKEVNSLRNRIATAVLS